MNSGENMCLTAARYIGPIKVNAGGALTITNSKVVGDITTIGASFVKICGSQITRGLNVRDSTGPVTVGDPASGCAGNQMSRPGVILTGNQAGVRFGGNTIVGDLACSSNVPGVTDGSQTNRATGTIAAECFGPPPTTTTSTTSTTIKP
ncbi:MAG: hypothetical protein M3137_13400, partial [Actinomycetota bacterium]|nr:hypothetical protein [Actinomycetota bacterium]